ncbi:mannitol dehydrogenase family protein [uncultured Jatrophihabitans sp.]|uniref:mannitol dehydrogenase family protein n=1 Tax=uncultured Jatrophihabitans sp. TaxID=1610747 RepID=UPI0035C9B6CE
MTGAPRRSSPRAPVRHVHLGLGNFFRAHQAWYTAHAPDAGEWGIAAFAGRHRALADALDAQDCLYTVITRSPDDDLIEVVPTLSAAHAATDYAAYLGYLADPGVALVTLTVTEAGYCRGADGGLDTSDASVRADLDALRADRAATVGTAPARLVAGLLARRSAGVGPIALVPCDNLPGNGAVVARVLRDAAAEVDATLQPWIDEHVAFVSTVVDRITPRASDADRDAVREWSDRAPVVTEPFHEWTLSGDFPGGRPAWEAAGARFVDDVGPFEQRKLWLLNGAHSLLAYAGLLRGHRTVAEATADPTLLGWVREWWQLAGAHLPLDPHATARYCDSLVERFTNTRLRHEILQIAADGSQKIPVRILPVLHAERRAGRLPVAAVRVLAVYVAALRSLPEPPPDPQSARLVAAARATPTAMAVRHVLGLLESQLAEDAALCDLVAELTDDLLRQPAG